MVCAMDYYAMMILDIWYWLGGMVISPVSILACDICIDYVLHINYVTDIVTPGGVE